VMQSCARLLAHQFHDSSRLPVWPRTYLHYALFTALPWTPGQQITMPAYCMPPRCNLASGASRHLCCLTQRCHFCISLRMPSSAPATASLYDCTLIFTPPCTPHLNLGCHPRSRASHMVTSCIFSSDADVGRSGAHVVARSGAHVVARRKH